MKKTPIHFHIQQMAQGNAEALTEFYRATSTAAYALALSLLNSREAAVSALEESYLTAYETAAAYCPKLSPMVWFLSIVYQQCSAFEKGTQNKDVPVNFSPVTALSRFAGFSAKDIAKITGLSPREIHTARRLKQNPEIAAFCENIAENVPDISSKVIISALLTVARSGKAIPEKDVRPIAKPQDSFRWKWLALGLAVLTLAIGAGLLYRHYANMPVVTTLYLDGATDIRITLDAHDRVVNIEGSEALSGSPLAGLFLRFQPVDTAMERIITTMVSRGYLKNSPDALLLTVSQNTDEQEIPDAVLQAYQQMLLTVLEEKNLPISLIVQALPKEERVAQIAQEHQISMGKAGFIHRLLATLTPYNAPKVAMLAKESPLYFMWHIVLEPVKNTSQLYFSESKGMEHYFTGEEILTRALYLMTYSQLRTPGSPTSLSQVAANSDGSQYSYCFSLNVNGNTYCLEANALTGNLISCTLNGDSVFIKYNSDSSGLEHFLNKEKAISLALSAVNCDADSVVFCTVQQSTNLKYFDILDGSLSASYSYVPGKYRVSFYTKDMYTHYCVDVLVTYNQVLNVQKIVAPKLANAISPREAISLAALQAGRLENTITSVFYKSADTAKAPYYTVHINFSDTHFSYYVDIFTGAVIDIRNGINQDLAIILAAEQFHYLPGFVFSNPQLSVTNLETAYRIDFSDTNIRYRVEIDAATGTVIYGNTLPVLTAENACELIAEAAGIQRNSNVTQDVETTDNEFIVRMHYENLNYVGRVCRRTGVILYFDTRAIHESTHIPQPLPGIMRTPEDALQLALEDAFATVNSVTDITVNSDNSQYYVISFNGRFLRQYTYCISAIIGDGDPILSKTAESLTITAEKTARGISAGG